MSAGKRFKAVPGWGWLLLLVVLTGAYIVRSHNVSAVFLWADETDFFNAKLFRNPPQPLIPYVVGTRDATTNTWGWPAILWIAARIFGGTVQVARTPGVIAGTLLVAAMFFLIYNLLPDDFPGNRFVPALGASLLAAIAMPQMEFSQRAYPYAAAPLMGALLLLAHTHLYRKILVSQVSGAKAGVRPLLRAMAWYAVIGGFVVCIHPSLNILVALSMLFLGIEIARVLAASPGSERSRIIRWCIGVAMVIGALLVLNRKNPKFGFRPYLAQYYHEFSLRSVVKAIFHGYDLATYHLNLFYNAALYWPERLNIVLLPLVILCAAGWWLSATGKYGPVARQLSRLAAAVIAVVAALSFFKLFPFGGVRQTLFLSPFLLVFTALGIYALRANVATRVAAGALTVGYLSLWTINLPKFYADRMIPYNEAELLTDWTQNGRVDVYPWYCQQTLEYVLRGHPEVPIVDSPPKAPFLLVSTRRRLDNDGWWNPVNKYLRKSGYKATLIDEKLPAHPESLKYSGSLYFPPSGLWVYRVTE
ncbi:MAG: hypothetical protein JO307_19050 [Bryobacterales bacterium]|nr:hypothetical protein [Bryobacterales bacterium]MBV9398734.1 hypothetical protein [Bryobacterales bacterium]